MKLYLIKRKLDGKFFVNVNGSWAIHCGHDGQSWSHNSQRLFKTPEGVAGNLRKLCSEPYWHTEPPARVCEAIKRGWRELRWENFDARRLDQFDVVITEVNILSTRTTPAAEFIQLSAIENAPLCRADRVASAASNRKGAAE